MAEISLLVVEDEILLAKDMMLRLGQLGYTNITVAHDGAVALKLLSDQVFDLAILDIQLGEGMDGVQLAHQINQLQPMPIVFLTSFSDKLTLERAKDCRPAAYMLKPYNERELNITIELALANYAKKKTAAALPPSSPPIKEDSYSLNDRLFLRRRDRFERVHFRDILWAEAQSNYTSIFTIDDKFMMAITLQEIAKQLSAPCFIRTHRSFLVNLDRVDSLEGNQLYIAGKAIPVSKSNREAVFHHFRKL